MGGAVVEFPAGAKLVFSSADADGGLDASGRTWTWFLTFWNEGRAKSLGVTVSHTTVDLVESDEPLDCGTEELTDVASSVVTPDAVDRFDEAFPNPPPYWNLFYGQWLPCVQPESSSAVHVVTKQWQTGVPGENTAFHAYFGDGAELLRLCGPCEGGWWCDTCT